MKRISIAVGFIFCLTVSVANAKQFTADIVVEMMGKTTGKIYVKDKKTSRTEMMGMTSITKKGKVYTLVSDTKKYVVSSTEEMQKENPAGAWGDMEAMINQTGIKKVGKEKVQGYSCVVYEGDVVLEEGAAPAHMKIWYSEKLDTMIKQEAQLGAPMGKMVTYLENITTGKVDKKLFEIPAGYTEAKDMTEAMGLGNLPMLQGGDEGEGAMPTEEQMKQMMEQMQNILEQQGAAQ